MLTQELQSKWYVAYTSPRSERIAKRKLDELGIENFLPLQKVVRQWSDRKKKMEVPLFPNYIFIKTFPSVKFKALTIKELVSYVSIEKQPVVVPEKVVTSLEKVLAGDVEISNERFANYEQGKVIIKEGKFAGAEGILIRANGKSRLVIRIEVLNQTVTVDVPSSSVEPCI